MWTLHLFPVFYPKSLKASQLLVLIIICIFIIVSPNITHNIMPSLVNYPQKWKRKFKGKHSWWPFLMRGAYADARPGYFHLISVAQLTLNSMRQEDSKWKLMMRTYRVPCVINQHAAGDVSGQCFHLISWTKWGLATYFWWGGWWWITALGLSKHWEENRNLFVDVIEMSWKAWSQSTRDSFNFIPSCS